MHIGTVYCHANQPGRSGLPVLVKHVPQNAVTCSSCQSLLNQICQQLNTISSFLVSITGCLQQVLNIASIRHIDHCKH